MHYNFNTYLRFRPDGDGSIYITLGVIMWRDYAQTTLTFNPSAGNMDYTPFSPRPRDRQSRERPNGIPVYWERRRFRAGLIYIATWPNNTPV